MPGAWGFWTGLCGLVFGEPVLSLAGYWLVAVSRIGLGLRGTFISLRVSFSTSFFDFMCSSWCYR